MRAIVLEQTVRARLITPDHPERPVRPTLRYTSADPFAVHIDFPARMSAGGESARWMFARTLLDEGLDAPAGIGAVRIRPQGRSRTVMELRSPLGMAVIRFGTAALQRFLLRSYDVVEPGSEDLGPVLDRGLTSLF